jgi:hypothetical protein
MFKEYVDCEIRVGPRRGKGFALSIHGPGGDAIDTLRLPGADPVYQNLENNLKRLNTDESMLAQLGQLLFHALFPGKLKEVFVRSQGALREGQGMRIVLNIDAAEQEVAALSWEFLYDPDQGPMALLDTPLVRYLPQSVRIPTLKTDLPLRVLLTGAQPSELPPIKVEQELSEVGNALAALEQQRRVQIVPEPHLTRSKLQQLLRQGFHVWHFAGHGGFKPDGKTSVLHFEDGEGDGESVNAMELGILLNRSGVRLIVLDACESGRLATEPFRTIAPAIIRAQVPAVIAMQFTFLDRAARAFAGELYRALAEGFPIDACVTEGRKAVMGAVGLGRPDWGIPVVYTRAPDGKLFDLPAEAAHTTLPTTTAQSVLPTSDADERSDKIANLRATLVEKQRRLHILQLRAARSGSSTPPDVLMDIEDLDGKRDREGNLLLDRRGNPLREGEIAKLKREIAQLGG